MGNKARRYGCFRPWGLSLKSRGQWKFLKRSYSFSFWKIIVPCPYESPGSASLFRDLENPGIKGFSFNMKKFLCETASGIRILRTPANSPDLFLALLPKKVQSLSRCRTSYFSSETFRRRLKRLVGFPQLRCSFFKLWRFILVYFYTRWIQLDFSLIH